MYLIFFYRLLKESKVIYRFSLNFYNNYKYMIKFNVMVLLFKSIYLNLSLTFPHFY